MNLTRWEPLNEIESLMDRLLNWQQIRPQTSLSMIAQSPKLDIIEGEEGYVFKVDVPGMEKQDLTVSVEGNMLTIAGERKLEREDSKPKFYRVERSYGRFSRCFSLPDDADAGSVHAHCDKGVLTVEVARKDGVAAAQPTAIPVE
ncbi:MAG: Hsp20/alpha crystallin family protein [Cyanobium sp. M30B3]|nr:MAG: Hsp20/alpha crystallin family protein [Cyanobium sp. M30B3]